MRCGVCGVRFWCERDSMFQTVHLKGLDDRDAKEVKLLGPVVAAAAAVTAEIPPEKRVSFERFIGNSCPGCITLY